ncbi:MAG: serpin family protein, partial [Verrucomicrobiota bacterium]
MKFKTPLLFTGILAASAGLYFAAESQISSPEEPVVESEVSSADTEAVSKDVAETDLPNTAPTAPTPDSAPEPEAPTVATPDAFPDMLTPDQQRTATISLASAIFRQSDPTDLSPTAADLTFAPASLTDALQVLWWGTRGETADEFADWFSQYADWYAGGDPEAEVTLSAPAGDDASVATVDKASLGGGVAMGRGVGLWVDDEFQVRADYLDLLKDRGVGNLVELDWSKTADAVAIIDDWGKEVTNGRINSLVSPESLNPPVGFAVTSAVHLAATWAQSFDPKRTEIADFSLLDGELIPASFLRDNRSLRMVSVHEDGTKVVEIPFSGAGFRMIAVLPGREGAKALRKVERQVGEQFEMWVSEIDSSEPREIRLRFPKFVVGSGFNPRPALESMGITKVFDHNEADFTGLSPIGGLRLDMIHHQAAVRLDETGVEAVATTAATVVPKTVTSDPNTFDASRPFNYFMLGPGNSVLFAGRVAAPEMPDASDMIETRV